MNKKKKILVVLLAVILLTGCTKYKNFEKKPVTIPETVKKLWKIFYVKQMLPSTNMRI